VVERFNPFAKIRSSKWESSPSRGGEHKNMILNHHLAINLEVLSFFDAEMSRKSRQPRCHMAAASPGLKWACVSMSWRFFSNCLVEIPYEDKPHL